MKHFWFIIKEIGSGKSVLRAFLNCRLNQEMLEGRILDLGSGGGDQYSGTVPRAQGAAYELFDLKKGQRVDFEKDRLPYENSIYDTVLLLNVLEHIYNYKHLLSEARRIKKENGTFIGFTPFLMWYHADHHDFFRYTHEALQNILEETGYRDIKVEPIYFGPYMSAFQIIYPTLPKFMRVIFVPFAYGLDVVFRKLRKRAAERYALGYYFKAR